MTTASDLAAFLDARFAEDEERATFVQREQAGQVWTDPEPWRLSWQDEYDLLCIEPSRALAEVESKRKLLDLIFEHAARFDGHLACCHDEEALRVGFWPAMGDWDEDKPVPASCLGDQVALEGLRLLAMPYADHPDFKPEWRPDA